MLFRDFIGAGGRGTVNDKDVPTNLAAVRHAQIMRGALPAICLV